MLSDEIAAARLALSLALQQSDPATLRMVAEGVCRRLDIVEEDAIAWQASAIVAPLARVAPANDRPAANDAGNVTRFPRRPQ